MIKPPEHIRAIKPYLPGKPVEELQRELGIKEAVKLASNENPLGPSPMALEALKGKLSGLNRYPDGSGFYLKRELSMRLGVDEDEIILGNGSNELLDIATRTFMTTEDEAVMANPSFVVYPMAVQSIGARSVQVSLKDWRHDLRTMAESITERTKIVFIANPNNPTGTINHKDEFHEFMSQLPEGVLVIVDEAYYEYVRDKGYPDTLEYFREGGDILILRTFSKVYGLAGLRIGYGIAKKELVTEINKLREPFNTNTPAQAAALASLGDSDHIQRSVTINEEGKSYLYGEFERLGMDYVPTEANFIYVKLKTPSASELFSRLLKKGVIIRPVGPDAVRITIGLPEENSILVKALEEELVP
ncbi:histidinol-phosphate aminotransferase 2 [bacterium BMS3Bbin06]|nr:histidinol-phosphate aminotransferase 2 [bacterium BMS3Abin08]GBE35436.1 histidinol-phosphate aminotransferase 2 [bacterium BMS3Bbin06]HDO35212.1 histidinol-phosphate transaminase [Nitrospirota bacterium]